MKNIIIVSPGRSGTSMMAGLLRKRPWYVLWKPRYFYGEKSFRISTRFNPKGFFEDPDINLVNEELLKSAGLQAPIGHKIPKIDQRWVNVLEDLNSVKANDTQRAEIERLVARKEPFCYKDPRFCYTLHIWNPHLNLDTVVFVCIIRDPIETALSIERFFQGMWDINVPVEQGLRVWSSMLRHVYTHSKIGQWLFFDFDKLLSDLSYRKRSLNTLQSLIGTKVDRKFIESQLRTQRVKAKNCDTLENENPELFHGVYDLYRKFNRLII